MRKLLLALAIPAFALGPALAAEEEEAPQTLHSDTWVCSSPEAYAVALERMETWPQDELEALKAQLLEEKLCMYIVEDDVEDMMAPFVEVEETRGDLVRIRFTIEFYRKFTALHAQFARVTFGGWTDKGNLRNYYQWLTGKPQT
jgi:hypothetical protein